MTAAEALEPDVVTAWLTHLYGDAAGWVSLFALDRTTGERVVRWGRANDAARLAAEVAKLAPTSCVWFGVATRQRRLPAGERGKREHCQAIPAMWVDIDVAGPNHARDDLPPTLEAAHELVAMFPLPPTAVVSTGGGLQAWWVLAKPIAVADGEDLLVRWGATWADLAARRGWHLDNVFDVARIMRMPGTWNTKADTKVAVEVVTEDWSRRWGVDDLEQYTIDPPEPLALVQRIVPYIGPERPGSAFNAVVHPGLVLERAGWTAHHDDRDGSRHYTRPGKERREGSSATVYPDGHCIVWTDAVPGLRQRGSYDAFGLYGRLFHGADWTAASDELERQGYGTKSIPVDLSWVEGEPDVPAAPATLTLRWSDDLSTNMPPEPPVLIDGLLRRGELCVFGAPRAIGKTWLGYNLASLLAKGEGDFCGALSVQRAARVMYLQGELDEWGSATRWKRLTPLGEPLPRIAETFDRVRIRVSRQRTTTVLDKGVTQTDEYLDSMVDPRLEATIVANAIDVLVIDPWAVYFGGNENSNDEVEAGLSRLREIMLRCGVAVVIFHHIGKGAEYREPEDLWRGASRLADWASTRVTIMPHYTEAKRKKVGLDRKTARRFVDVFFLRRSTPTDDFSMHLDDDGWWRQWTPEPDESDDGTAGPPDPALRALGPEDVIEALEEAGGSLPSKLALARALGAVSVSDRMRRVIEAAVGTGEVTIRPGRGTSEAISLTREFRRNGTRDENSVAGASRLDDQVAELGEPRRGSVAGAFLPPISAGQGTRNDATTTTPYGGDLSALDEPPTDTPSAVVSAAATDSDSFDAVFGEEPF